MTKELPTKRQRTHHQYTDNDCRCRYNAKDNKLMEEKKNYSTHQTYLVPAQLVRRLVNYSYCHFVAFSRVHVALVPCSNCESYHRRWAAWILSRWTHVMNPLRNSSTDIHESLLFDQRHRRPETLRDRAALTRIVGWFVCITQLKWASVCVRWRPGECV